MELRLKSKKRVGARLLTKHEVLLDAICAAAGSADGMHAVFVDKAQALLTALVRVETLAVEIDKKLDAVLASKRQSRARRSPEAARCSCSPLTVTRGDLTVPPVEPRTGK
jgi:hypothetical protein